MKEKTRMQVLLTGASGFLGFHVLQELASAGYAVRALCLPTDPAPRLQSLPIQIVVGDVLKPETLAAACADCHAVIHSAGRTNLHISGRRLLRDLHVQGTQNVLAAAQTAGVKRVVYVSSLGVLGAHAFPQAVSETQPAPNAATQKNTYHLAKREAEHIALAFNSSKLDVISVLPSMLWGPEDWDLSSTGLVRLLLMYKRMLYAPLGGTSILDVADAARGMVLALQHGHPGKRYLLAGDNLTNDDFFTQLCAAVDPQLKPQPIPLAFITASALAAEALAWMGLDLDFSMDTRNLCGWYWWGDSQRAETELGFKRQFTWPQTLHRTLVWHREHFDALTKNKR